MATGWIALHREITDHWVWRGEPFSKGQAWVDLILTANHEDKTVMFDGKPITVQRGCLLTSEVKLADRWGWSRKKVHRFLDMLECDGMLSRVCPESVPNMAQKGAYLSLCNYSDWQESGTGKEQARNRQGTGKAHKQQYKQLNNITKDLKDLPASLDANDRFDEFWSIYPKKVDKKKARVAFDRIPKREIDAVISDVMRRSSGYDWTKEAGRYVPNPTTYIHGERWKDEGATSTLKQTKTQNGFHNFEGRLSGKSEKELEEMIKKRWGQEG